MRIGLVTESPADDVVIKILIDALIGREVDIVAARARAGGWPSVLHSLPVEFKRLHYNTDAHAIVAIADADDSNNHDDGHDPNDTEFNGCRFCELMACIVRPRTGLRPRATYPPMLTAIGLAYPAIEAWLLCGKDNHCVEAHFERTRLKGKSLLASRKELKIKLYGTVSPPTKIAMEVCSSEAFRLTSDLPMLERLFPRSFGAFARQIRAW